MLGFYLLARVMAALVGVAAVVTVIVAVGAAILLIIPFALTAGIIAGYRQSRSQ
jgi:hypothetical protein